MNNIGKKIFNKDVFRHTMNTVFISLIYGVLGMFNFATMTFDPARTAKVDFWINYAVIMGLGLTLLFLAISMKKDSLKHSTPIKDKLDVLQSLRDALFVYGIYDDFDVHICELNKTLKKDRYIQMLTRKKGKAKKKEKKEEYTKLLAEAEQTDFDITKIKMRYKPFSINLMFSGLQSEGEADSFLYTGRENLPQKVLPVVLTSAVFAALGFSLMWNISSPTGEQIKNVLMTLFITLSHLVRGLNYGEYSVNEVYASVLDRRTGEVRKFLHKMGLIAEIEDNPNYKYKIVIENKKSEEDGAHGCR